VIEVLVLLGAFCGCLAFINAVLGPAPDEKGTWPWQR
jgi:hypothetical protein